MMRWSLEPTKDGRVTLTLDPREFSDCREDMGALVSNQAQSLGLWLLHSRLARYAHEPLTEHTLLLMRSDIDAGILQEIWSSRLTSDGEGKFTYTRIVPVYA